MKSPVYLHPVLYEFSLRLIYGSNYSERLRAVADLIPDGSEVTDVCAGDCAIYRYVLRRRNVRYLACDNNDTFLHWGKRRGIPTRRLDLERDEIPPSDCILLMGSLYQFIPREREILIRLRQAAKRQFIVTEPIRNFAQSRYAVLRWLGRLGTHLDQQACRYRFTQETLEPLLVSLGFQTITLIAGEREMLGLFNKEKNE